MQTTAPIADRDVGTLTLISGGAASGLPPSPREWVQIQPLVRQLYVTDRLPLQAVRDTIERRHGFRASQRMYKDRLKKWGYLKNSKREDWLAVAQLDQGRDPTKNTVFLVHGKSKTRKDLQKYIRSLRLSKEEFLSSEKVEVPDYIRCCTPEADGVRTSPSDSSSNSFSTPSPQQEGFAPVYFESRGMMREGPARPLFWPSPDGLSPLEPSSMPQLENSPQSDSVSTALTTSTSTAATSMEEATYNARRRSPCPLEYEVEVLSQQVVEPGPLQRTHSISDFHSWTLVNAMPTADNLDEHQLTCGECTQPWSMHFKSLDSLVPQHFHTGPDVEDDSFVLAPSPPGERPWKWVALCFAASIQLRKGPRAAQLADMALRDASVELEKLVRRRDPLLLTAAGQMITILHQHDQGPIAHRILQTASDVCALLLDPSDAVRITMTYLTFSANLALTGCGITSNTLHHVHSQLLTAYGPTHPYTIAAHYNYGWLLKLEKQYALAESQLLTVYNTSCQIFGRHHMQSLVSLASASGAQIEQGKHAEGILNIHRVLRDGVQTLGPRHPYLLDGKRRLANLYCSLERWELAVGLYREVLVGRIEMLGKTHRFTGGARNDYERVLKEVRGWSEEEVRREMEGLFSEMDTPGSPNGSEASGECKGY